MVKRVDGIRLHGLSVRRRVRDNVAADHDGHLPPWECLAQLAQVSGIGDVHREILREDVDIELIGHGHRRDAAADAVGLRALRPREFVDGEQHLEAEVADGAHDALV